MSNDAAELRMEEYKSLRAEALERIREANTLIITTAAGVGGAYAVIVSTFAREPHLEFSRASGFTIISFLVIMWAPVLFSAVGLIKSNDMWTTVLRLAKQVRLIEDFVYGLAPPFPGWEHQMEIYRNMSTPPRQRLLQWVWRQRLLRRWVWPIGDQIAHPPYSTIYWSMFLLSLSLGFVSIWHIWKVTS
jgi:hypothetical protein